MSLHTGTAPHPDRPRRPLTSRRVLLQRNEEVHAVAAGVRRLHLAPPDFAARDRWVAGGKYSYLVQRRPERRSFDPNEPNTLPDPGPTAQVVVVEAALVLLGDLTIDDARLMFGKRASMQQLRDWWLIRHDAAWWEQTTDDTPWGEYDARWRSWAEWQVWRIRWTLDTRHRPRLLGKDGGPSYVTSPGMSLPGAGEAPPEEWQEERSAAAAPDIAKKTAAAAALAAEMAHRQALVPKAGKTRDAERVAHKKALREQAVGGPS